MQGLCNCWKRLTGELWFDGNWINCFVYSREYLLGREGNSEKKVNPNCIKGSPDIRSAELFKFLSFRWDGMGWKK